MLHLKTKNAMPLITTLKNVVPHAILIGILALALLSCGADSEDVTRSFGPVQFTAADPPSGSTLLSNATLTVSFDGVPKNLRATQGTVSSSTRTATISGPFTVGQLHLTLTWEDGTHTLIYTVEPVPIKIVSVKPPAGSTLLPDAAVTVSFDGVPNNLRVTPGDVQLTGTQATITGPFSRGTLNLAMKWETGTHTLDYTVEFAVPDGMVLITDGEFQMGSDTALANNDEQPVHTIYTDAFYMDTHEVTVGAYREFVQETGHRPPDWSEVARYAPTDEHPIVFVSWHDAMAYAKWAGKRLPTEAEWEKAARGGLVGQQTYPWGDTAPDGTQCNFADKNLKHYWWADRDADDNYAYTAPVKSYRENGYGVYDMAGNVAEWCLDEYDADFYAVSPGRNPVSGIDTLEGILETFSGVQSLRVLRGGSWLVNAQAVRSAARFRLPPSDRSSSVGFRCAKDLPF